MSESVDLDKMREFVRTCPMNGGDGEVALVEAIAHIEALVAEVERLRAEAWARHHTNPFA